MRGRLRCGRTACVKTWGPFGVTGVSVVQRPAAGKVTAAHRAPTYPCPVSIPDLSALRAMGAAQQPAWPDRPALDTTVERLRKVPPLVFAGECDELKGKLAAVASGEAFLL